MSSKTAQDKRRRPRCPDCGREITTSIAINDRNFKPVCMPCVTKKIKSGGLALSDAVKGARK